MSTVMDSQEARLVEALKKIDEHGDVAPPHVHDPAVMMIRQIAVRSDLIRWDMDRGRYVLTGTGRNRIAARQRSAGSVIRFRLRGEPREDKDGKDKPAKSTA